MEGIYWLVYTSPEMMLSKGQWRKVLTSDEFKDHCIGVPIDEAHNVAHW